MFSKSPTARSMRITGRLDQKLIPRVACNVVMRISVAGSALSDALIVDSGRARMGANRGERRRHLLGEYDEQVVVAEQRHRVVDGVSLAADLLDLGSAQTSRDEPFAN